MLEYQQKHLILLESMFFSTGFEACKIAKELGYKVTLICRDFKLYLKNKPLNQHPLGLADFHIETETNDAKSLIQFLENYYEKNPFHGLLTFSDYYVDIAAQVATYFGFLSPSPKSVQIARNKDLSRICLLEKSVPSAKFHIVKSFEEALKAAKDIGYPCVVKPTAETSSYGVECVFNDEQLLKAFNFANSIIINERGQRREGKVLIEEYMVGEEVSVETISINGDCHVLGITSKGLTGWPNFVECEFSFPYKIPENTRNSVIDVVKSALNAIGYFHGPCHTEIKLTKEGPKVVEINPRLGGRFISKMISDSLGIDPIKEVIKLAMGDSVDLLPKRNIGTAWSAITAPSTGFLKEIKGKEEVLKSSGVEIFILNAKIGDFVRKPTNNGDTIGYIYTLGKDAADARDNLKKAREKLQLIISS
ncbi:ATP-dependent carboxylate-amine ligase [Anoxybacillus flavithermus]|nr:ATP-dependent carboxylate-amine ligase [Anoxybacillus flavithermus]